MAEADGDRAERQDSSVAGREAAEQHLTRVELEIELRQSIGRQLYQVLGRPTGDREERPAEPARQRHRGE